MSGLLGIIDELTSAPNAILSVSAFPKVKLPLIVALPPTIKLPLAVI